MLQKKINLSSIIQTCKTQGGNHMNAITITKENFRQEIMNTDKPVLLDFWAPWCGPCQITVPVIEQIAKERDDIKVGKINVDEQPELAQQFQIMSIPALFVIKDKQIVNQAVGAKPKAEILKMIQEEK